MFASCFEIKQWTGVRTLFHKKYYVFDGIGSFFFNNLIEARSFVRSRVSLLKNSYNESLKIYSLLSTYHVRYVARFRDNYLQNSTVCDSLSQCLWYIEKLSSSHYPLYRLSNLRKLLDKLLYISNLLKKPLLSSRIVQIINNFFIEYPVYKSTSYKSNNKQIKNEKSCYPKNQKMA